MYIIYRVIGNFNKLRGINLEREVQSLIKHIDISTLRRLFHSTTVA